MTEIPKTLKSGSITKECSTMDGLCQILEEIDAEYVFGIPGGYMGKLYDALYESPKVKPILVRHEQIASIMAEVFGRLTGKPGVFTAQGAWTLSNGLMGPLEAVQGSSPMLILTDMTDNFPYSHHGSYQAGTGEYGGYDVKKVLDAVTKYATAVYGPEQALQSVQLAVKHAVSGNPGPVGVVFHSSAINGKIKPDSSPIIYHSRRYLVNDKKGETHDKIKQACQVLSGAKRPFIIAGNGVHGSKAYAELQTFAEMIGAPVGTTAQGKSAIAETHPNAVGVLGNWGQDAANELLSEADVILAVGSRLAPTDTCNETTKLIDPSRQTMIQIDIEAKHASWVYPVDIPLIGDAKIILNQLIDTITPLDAGELQARTEKIKACKLANRYMVCDEMESDAIPILPQRLVKELQEAVDEDTVITLDAGENRVFMTHFFKSKAAGSIIPPASAGGMGYAMPAALAVKLVKPQSKVVAVTGDGGFAMTMNALITSVQYTIPFVTIIFNNSALGWVKNAQHGRIIASEYDNCNFADMAKAMGCDGIRVENPDELVGVIKRALASGRTTVIDVATTDRESYKKVMSAMAVSLED
ncbi:thiamine pyrophosphate-binding protein [Paenibacillus naphthalenovorans]|uniref:thiamine pyrophosphate-binding protein n=1 Tax=Paenibacillus naphthalenovorans TaxID=162209 RepID=UPI000882AA7D|nr:thiamine pyrophosphate-binding protein [Paenibacillus naphthalenovorans]SDI01380.1 acetolactate synthase-1/2/3 large subunit [Paenibacillus naphthalenovorans]